MSMYRLKHWIVAAGLVAVFAPAAYAQKEAAAKGPSISKAVAKQVKAAQDAIKKEKWADCVAALQSTEAVADKPPYDVFAVAELVGFCAARSGDTAGAEAAFSKGLEAGFLDDSNRLVRYKQLLQLNYNLKAYERAAGFGEQAIAAGNTEEAVALLTAQSYYLLNDFKRTTSFIDKWLVALQARAEKPAEIALQLYVSSCSKLDDDTCILKALEKQLEFHPRPETPGNVTLVLLRNAVEANTLNVFRYAFEAGGMRRGEDYAEMAQLSIEKGFPGEALAVVEAGIAANVFNTPALTDLSKRLLASAKTQVAADKPTLAKQDSDAAARKNGEIDVRIGQAYLSYNDYTKAVSSIERGIAKGGVRNANESQLMLGIARLKAGNKEGAREAFAGVQADQTLKDLARLWTLRTR
jgi:Tfp pilus assembly protein PilF